MNARDYVIVKRDGDLATRKQFFGENRRYAVAPIHTRFDALEWFVWDAEHPLSDLNHAEVIRQAETLFSSLAAGTPATGLFDVETLQPDEGAP